MTLGDSGLSGRETATPVALALYLLAMASTVMGFVLVIGSSWADELWVWPIREPLTAGLAGVAFIGSAPLLVSAASRRLWVESRIAMVPATVLLVALVAITLRSGATWSGSLPHQVVTGAWYIGVGALTLLTLLALARQATQPGEAVERLHPLPRPTLPLLAVLGSALFGLGVALLGGPDFWAPVVPWPVTHADAALLGAWALILGVAVLLTLFEDDLHRVRPGFTTLTVVGLFGLVVLGWRHDAVEWSSWGAAATVALLLGMMVSGLVGRILFNRATRGVAP